jgi:lipopolysaccharide transport system permease protein
VQVEAAPTQLEAPLYGRKSILREGWEELKATWRFRTLLRALVSSSLRKRAAGTLLGQLWWLLDPIFLIAIYYVFVSGFLHRGGEGYWMWLAVSIVAWHFFSVALRHAVGQTANKERQTRHVRFPKIVLPTSIIITESARFLVAIVLVILAIMGGGVYPSLELVYLPVVIVVNLTWIFTLSFLLAPLNIFFRDVQRGMNYFIRAWFFLSPVLYPVSVVVGQYRTLYELNPFATIIPAYRAVILDHQFYDPARLLLVGGIGTVFMMLTFLFFVRLERSFAKAG